MPKFTLNEQELEAQPGQTIIQAAMDHGLEIPHYCYHPDLPIDGNCRMCLVDVEKIPKLTPACATVVSEGMVVRSHTDRVKEAVRGVLEFLLINHPVDCPVCDQAGECRLQDYYMVYGLHTSDIPLESKVRKRKVIDLGPMVVLDQERCVLCSRCVRFCDHVTGTGELQFFGRGDHVAIGTFEDRPIENPYSGNVVDICPVGALTSRDFRFKCRVWFLNSADSVCAGCSTGCNARIDHRDETIFRLIPRRNAEVNLSWMCDEGRLTFHELNKGERAIVPMTKGADGAQSRVSWEVAAREIDSRLRQTGGDAVLGFASASLTNEALFSMKRYLESLGASKFEFRLDGEDRKATEREDEILRRLDKRPNSTGAVKLGFADGGMQSIDDAIRAAKAGQVRAAIVTYIKPLVVRDSQREAESRIAELVRSLEYSVVLATHKADWHSAASAVIPIAAWSEEQGTYTNHEGRVQMANRAVHPPGEARPAWQVFAMLAGASPSATAPVSAWRSASQVFDEISASVPGFKGMRFEHTRLPGALPRD